MLRVFEPLISEADNLAVNAALEGGWISSTGPFVEGFERKLEKAFGVEYAITMNSGTSALEAAVHALQLPAGSQVIMPAFTIVSCVNAVLVNDLVPVFVDIETDTWNIDCQRVRAAITEKTSAIMCVHMYGMTCNVIELEEIAKQYQLALIEDASQVHGAEVDGRHCGSFGDVSVFSFFANKIVTTGEGGAVCTNSSSIAERSREYRNLYIDAERRFKHRDLGKNFRLTSIQAALGESQLASIKDTLARKRALGKMYIQEFEGLPIRKRLSNSDNTDCVYWMNAFEFEFPIDRDVTDLYQLMHENGFETRYFFSCLHEQPFLQDRAIISGCLRNSISASKNGIYFPSSHKVQLEDIQAMRRILDGFFS